MTEKFTRPGIVQQVGEASTGLLSPTQCITNECFGQAIVLLHIKEEVREDLYMQAAGLQQVPYIYTADRQPATSVN
jgi:hypothetical protein